MYILCNDTIGTHYFIIIRCFYISLKVYGFKRFWTYLSKDLVRVSHPRDSPSPLSYIYLIRIAKGRVSALPLAYNHEEP